MRRATRRAVNGALVVVLFLSFGSALFAQDGASEIRELPASPIYGSTLDYLIRYVAADEFGPDHILELWTTIPVPIAVPQYKYHHFGDTIDYRDVLLQVVDRVESRIGDAFGEPVDVFVPQEAIQGYGIRTTCGGALTWAQFEQHEWSSSRAPRMARLNLRGYTTADATRLEFEIEHALIWLLLCGDGDLRFPGSVNWFRANSDDLSNADLVREPLGDADYEMIALALSLGSGTDLMVIAEKESRAPIIVADYPEESVLPEESIVVDASGSLDPNGDVFSLELRQIQGFEHATVKRQGETSFAITVPKTGDYVFELVAEDAEGLTDVERIHIYALADCTGVSPILTKGDLIVAAYYITMWGRANYSFGFADVGTGDRSIDFTLGAPDRHALLGNYDCADPRIADWHIKMAVENGVNCFVIPNARPAESWAPEKNFEDGLLRSQYIDRIRFAMLFNTEPWWDSPYLNDIISFEDLIEETIEYYCDHYFSHPSYLHVDGKPVLFLYHSGNYYSVKGEAPYLDYVTRVRSAALAKGYDIYLLGDTVCPRFDPVWHAVMAEPLDAAGSYCSIGREWDFNRGSPYVVDTWGNYLEGNKAEWAWYSTFYESSDVGFVPNAAAGVDNRMAFDLGYDNWLVSRPTPTAEEFQDFLAGAVDHVDPEVNMLTIYAWNEYHEGAILEPTIEQGFTYLEIVRDLLGVRPVDGWPENTTP